MIKFKNLIYNYNGLSKQNIYSSTFGKKWSFLEMSRIMWTSASLSMTGSELAVCHAGSQVLSRGEKAQRPGHKRHRTLGKTCSGIHDCENYLYSKESHEDLLLHF